MTSAITGEKYRDCNKYLIIIIAIDPKENTDV